MTDGITFKPGGTYDQSRTATRETVTMYDARRKFRVDYLRGWGAAARDIELGLTIRGSFGSFAFTAYALGYRAAIAEAGREG